MGSRLEITGPPAACLDKLVTSDIYESRDSNKVWNLQIFQRWASSNCTISAQYQRSSRKPGQHSSQKREDMFRVWMFDAMRCKNPCSPIIIPSSFRIILQTLTNSKPQPVLLLQNPWCENKGYSAHYSFSDEFGTVGAWGWVRGLQGQQNWQWWQ